MSGENKNNKPAQIQKNIVDLVLGKITTVVDTGGIKVPSDYSVNNAIQAAGLIIADLKDKNDKSALEVCTSSSIANSLFYMTIQGLNPFKNQCYFIIYKDKLVCRRGYQGAIMLAKRYSKVKNVFAHTIYEGDEFVYMINQKTGLKQVVEHKPSLENINQTKIRGAYAIVQLENGLTDYEIMTFNDIKSAWLMRVGNGLTTAHTTFTDQMCEKTVISRACKKYINSTSDSVILESDNSEEIEKQEENKEPEKKKMLFEIEEAKNNNDIKDKESGKINKEEKPGF